MKIGCHVANKGEEMLAGSVIEAVNYGANCFMVYLGAPQNTFRKSAAQLNIELMKELLDKHNIDIEDIVVHAPYIINLAQSEKEKQNFAINFLINEINNVSLAGLKTIVLHPGAHVGFGPEKGLDNIVNALKEVLEKTKDLDVDIALETMAGKGTELGRSFEEIEYLIDEVNSPRIKVCLDTCHIFDAGYDIVNNYEEIIEEFDKIVGLDKLKVIHVNDSKNKLGSKKDRHENIGYGNIGFETLIKFFYDERFKNIPKILETPYVKIEDTKKSLAPYKYEINMIKAKTFNENLIEDILKQK